MRLINNAKPKSIQVNCESDFCVRDLTSLVILPFESGERNFSTVLTMALSLVTDGLLEPLVVWPELHDTYLMDGHIRCHALKYLRSRFGYHIPPIPVKKVYRSSMREAKRLFDRLH